MPDKKVTDDLIELERRYWQAIKDRDTDTLMLLTDEACLVTGAQGVARLERAHLAQMMKNVTWRLVDFRIDDAQILRLGEDVAVVAYRVHEDVTVDGKPLTLDAADASTWVRRGGEWRCALHTESLKGDSFGRDRQPST